MGAYGGESALFGSLEIFQCRECGLAYADPMPSATELDDYNAAYFAHAHGGQESTREAVVLSSALARLRLDFVWQYVDRHGGTLASVFEIGPGHGYFLGHLRKRFPEAGYTAVESDASCRRLLGELGAAVFPTLESLPEANLGRFDLAFASHVLEHLPDPVAFVAGISRCVRPGGTIFIEVPCRDFEFKSRHEPHLLFFDEQSLHYLLRSLGLVEIETTYHGRELRQLMRAGTAASRVRARLAGLTRRLAPSPPELHWLENAAERRIVAPFEAHLTKREPSWWLRALARRPG